MKRCFRTLVAAVAFGSMAYAGEWYVDPVHGNNANSGTSPIDAWRTLAWANAHVPIGAPETLHLAPGTFHESTTFVIRPRWRIVGDAGSDATFVEYSGAGVNKDVFAFLGQDPFNYSYGPDTELRGVSIHGTLAIGVVMYATGLEMSPTIIDVRVTGSLIGLWYYNIAFGGPTAAPSIQRMRMNGCGEGIRVSAGATNTQQVIRISDCEVTGSNYGLQATTRNVTLGVRRSRFIGNVNAGAAIAGMTGVTTVLFEDCLFAQHPGGVYVFPQSTASGSMDVTMRHCTIADNSDVGFAGFSRFNVITSVRLENTIVARNGDDVIVDPTAQVSFSCIQDGDFAGANGNFAADPEFVDAAAGDYRLRWASRCIDAGDPATPVGVLDLAGRARPIDGNLDAAERADIGAFEFAPLEVATTEQLGSIASFAFWGERGSSSQLFFTREATVAPIATPFGELDLRPQAMRKVLLTKVGTSSPAIVPLTLPSDPAWIGHTLAYQGLTRCSLAAAGAAYTNAEQFTIVP